MKHVLTLFLALTFGIQLYSGSGIFQTYIILDVDNGGNNYYAGGINSDGATTIFNDSNYNTPSSLILKGGEIKTFKNGGSNVSGAFLNYRVYKQGNTAGSFVELSLPYDSELGGGDQRWDETDLSIDLLALAADGNGTYNIEVFWKATSSDQDHFDSNFMNNFIATFDIAVMPVTFSNLNLVSNNQAHLLSFTTATETNNAYFHIERSTDSRNWEKLGTIAGAGTTQQEQQYRFLDEAPLPGLNYYRVKQVDYDGSFSYSAIVSARWEGKPQVHLFPNPADDLLQISGLPTTDGPVTIEIIDMAGRVMLKQTWNQTAINVAQLADGIYSLRISSAEGVIDNQQLFIR
jgi:hypothetical protein